MEFEVFFFDEFELVVEAEGEEGDFFEFVEGGAECVHV